MGECDRSGTYRCVYVVKFQTGIYALHAFQKKSHKGIATPQEHIDLIKRRLKLAAEMDEEAAARKKGERTIMNYTISSGNVFADAGLPDAEECLARSELLYYIMTEVKRRGLSLRQAASLLDVPQSHIRLLLRGRLSEFSLEYLLQMVKKLGLHVVISCQPTMEDEQGHVTIDLPQSA